MPPPSHPHIVATTLRSLQRVDPGITRTLAQAYAVAYSEAEGGTQPWEKMGVEGGLFVYESTSSPKYGIIILNRHGIKNYQKPLVPHDTTIHVDGPWLYVTSVDMDAFRISPPHDTPTKRNQRQGKTKQDPASGDSVPNPGSPKTRIALFCHSANNATGDEEARRLADFLTSLCGTPSTDAPDSRVANPPLIQSTSEPVITTRSQPENPVSPTQEQAQTAGMSMAAILEKLSQKPTPGKGTHNPAHHASPPPNDALRHSASLPPGRPLAQNGMTSPIPPPPQPSTLPQGQDQLTATLKQMLGLNMGGQATTGNGSQAPSTTNGASYSQQPFNQASLLMTPTRTPALTTGTNCTATPPAHHQQIHLAPALSTPGPDSRSQSPLVRPSMPPRGAQVSHDSRSYVQAQGYPPQGYPQQQPPGTYPSHHSMQQHPQLATYPSQSQLYPISPRPPMAQSSIHTSSAGQHGGDVFIARGGAFDPAAATQAVVGAWSNRPLPSAQNGVEHASNAQSIPDQSNLEQKREFMNALLGAIHTDRSFVDRLWEEYCGVRRRHLAPPG